MTTHRGAEPGRALLDELVGVWTLDRSISPEGGTVTGTVEFTRVNPDRLFCQEKGLLILSTGYVGEVSRDYFYQAADNAIRILFGEQRRAGQTLHLARLDATGRRAHDVHQCGEDTYEGWYEFRSTSLVTSVMQVRGPAKHYTLRTRLHRSTEPGA